VAPWLRSPQKHCSLTETSPVHVSLVVRAQGLGAYMHSTRLSRTTEAHALALARKKGRAVLAGACPLPQENGVQL